MTRGMCLCVGCMCGVMKEGMCEKCNQVCHATDGLVEGMPNVMLWTADTQLSTLKPGN